MLSHETSAALKGPIRIMQIIVGALVTGPLVFLIFALVTRGGAAKPREGASIATYAAIGLAVCAITARMIVPDLVTAAARKKIASGNWQVGGEDGGSDRTNDFFQQTGDAGKLCIVFQTRLIIGSALLEGSAFLAILAFLFEGLIFALLLACLLLMGILLGFPTASVVEHWIDGQLQLLKEDRRLLG